ncbi:MAG TPA: lipid II flippase MurJ [Ilumatobacteraceae bacterium]|nr:lipid II flippase MurJ [Ilumatobacteraceae bacterium]
MRLRRLLVAMRQIFSENELDSDRDDVATQMTTEGLDQGVSSSIRRDTILVTLCTLFSRITGFGRVVATAAVLGVGLLGDVYQTANMIPNLMFELVAGGVLQAVLVPSFVAARREGGDATLSEATQATSAVIMLVLTMVAIVGAAASPLLGRLLLLAEPSQSIAASKLHLMVPMVLVFVPQLICYGVSTVTSAALNAKGGYVAAALAPAVNNVIVIIACVAFRATRDGAVADLNLTHWEFVLIAGGTTLAVVVSSLTPALALRRAGVHWLPRWHPRHPAVQSMRRSFGWATLSIVGTLVPTAAALALGNGAPGGVAVFVYAFAFYVLPHALIAVTIATTLGPRVADGWQAGRVDEVRAAIDYAMRVTVPLLVLAGAGMVALAWPLTRLVAGVGQTSGQGLAPIAHTLAAFGPGLVGYGSAFIMTRVLFVLGDVRRASTLMVAGAVVGVVTMAVASALLPTSSRAAALAIGYGAAQTVSAVLLGVRVRRLTGALHLRRIGRLVLESLVSAAASIAMMVWLVISFDTTRRQALVAFLLGGSAGVAVFACSMSLFRRRELFGRRSRQPG